MSYQEIFSQFTRLIILLILVGWSIYFGIIFNKTKQFKKSRKAIILFVGLILVAFGQILDILIAWSDFLQPPFFTEGQFPVYSLIVVSSLLLGVGVVLIFWGLIGWISFRIETETKLMKAQKDFLEARKTETESQVKLLQQRSDILAQRERELKKREKELEEKKAELIKLEQK